ncbi:winged helix-turn-helix domain-containing tetratricopeptide repeat protein [Ruegeria sp. HKCCD8929]|uniref:winged helix-turn-helix domain-containing tetratricopeptide repeat protein n=1 Tax=Ruegeria sp. HKCCD8929 TaxID=2683006 RepID=UPI001489114C|nr:winged helix-turn-helix domain-containing protein [Ruegeria sp. HKCCD8929]
MSRNGDEIDTNSSEIVRIGDFTLSLENLEIQSVTGQTVDLRSQSADVLAVLVQHAGEIVSKDTLIDRVWADTFVTDDSLVQCIADIRRALGDTDHKLVQTFPKKGYKLNATPVDTAEKTVHTGLASRASPSARRRNVIAIASLAALALIGMIYLIPGDPPRGESDHSPRIAVLAFDDFSAGEDKGYLSDAIAEGIITELARSRFYDVIARNSSFRYRGQPIDIHQIGEELGVQFVLEGSQQKSGDKLKVTAQLIDATTGEHLWAHTYDQNIGDLFVVQDQIVRTLADRVGERLMRPSPVSDPDKVTAQHLFLKARQFVVDDFSEASNWKAYETVQKIFEVDPDSHYAHLGMVFVYRHAGEFGWHGWDRQEAFDTALEHGLKALEIAADDPSTHYLLALLRGSRGENEEALAHYDKAVALNPSASRYLAASATPLLNVGRTDEAIERLERAKGIDPFHSRNVHWRMGWALWQKGDCEGALDAFLQMDKIVKGAHRMLAAIYACLGEVEKAQDAYKVFYADAHEPTIAEQRAESIDTWTAPGALERYLDHMRIAGMKD